MLYPSSVEGFGLVPFEAAAHGTPTLSTRRGSLAEVLPASIPVLDGYEVAAAAQVAWDLLHDEPLARRVVETVRAHGATFTWEQTAKHLEALFADALHASRGRTSALEGQPVVSTSRGPHYRAGARTSDALEVMVRAVILRPQLKRRLSPHGSQRQRAARAIISRARRGLARSSR